jgi:hypothetical protein
MLDHEKKTWNLYNPLLEVRNFCVQAYTVELVQSDIWLFWLPVTLDKYLWSQFISIY